MNRIVCFGAAMFIAVVGIALIAGQQKAVAGGGGYVVSSCGGYVVDACGCDVCQPAHASCSCSGGGLFARMRAKRAARQAAKCSCSCSGVVVSSCHGCHGGVVCGGVVVHSKGGPVQHSGPIQHSGPVQHGGKGPVQHGGKVMSYGPVHVSCSGYSDCCGVVASCHGCSGPVRARHRVRTVRRCHGGCHGVSYGCHGCSGWSCGGYYGGGVVMQKGVTVQKGGMAVQKAY